MGSRPSKGGQGYRSPVREDPNEPSILYTQRYMVVALYNYPAGGPAECSICLGERLNVLSDEGDWWRVSSTATGKESYMPSNYTAKVYHSMLMMTLATPVGAYSLSVRWNTGSSWDSVKHYRIHRLQNGWFYISPGLTFSSLIQLVDHYSETLDGLCCLLKEPCFIVGSNKVPVVTGPPPMAIRKPTLNWKDVDSAMLFGNEKVDEEESQVSEGLREAINSYLFLTDCEDCDLRCLCVQRWLIALTRALIQVLIWALIWALSVCGAPGEECEHTAPHVHTLVLLLQLKGREHGSAPRRLGCRSEGVVVLGDRLESQGLTLIGCTVWPP
ncbi:hypothetical protein JZ751_014503 [Albula glossodonta]|uniref:Src-like-adapter 2 n=1 Tax=Albula glossodonta TaxID=121402 RepID=A0A8T2MWB0_9TELE|nr:hypothetical protein JZ751_014503 [Albula glossodonta]